MRKATLIIALFVALGVKAQVLSHGNSSVAASVNTGIQPMGVVQGLSSGSEAVRKALPSASTVITEQPAGTLIDNLYRKSMSYYNYGGYAYYTMEDGAIGKMVIGDDGNMYLYNPMLNINTQTWLKMEPLKDDTLVVRLPQVIYAGTYMGYTYCNYAARMIFNSDAYQWEVDKQNSDIKMVWRNDSLIQIDDCMLGQTDEMLLWNGFGEVNTLGYIIKDKMVEAPADIQAQDYMMTYGVDENNRQSKIVNVGIDGNDVYIKNLNLTLPESWIKGTIDGNKVVFPSKQYMGADTKNGNYAFFFGGADCEMYDEEFGDYYTQTVLCDKLTFDYDPANKTLRTDSLLIINGGSENLSYINVYEAPKLEAFNEVPGVPQNPIIVDYVPFNDEKGYSVIYFTLPLFDISGNALNKEKLYYHVMVDNEPFTFYPDEYIMLSEEMTEIPYLFTDKYDFISAGSQRSVVFYFIGFDNIGIQSVYKGGGEVNKSEIVNYVPVEDGITSAGDNRQVEMVEYYNAAGCRISQPHHGIFVKKVTYNDGSQRIFKRYCR